MVNIELVEAVVNKLAIEGIIFVQTDIDFLAEEMFTLFRADHDLSEIATDKNPFPVKTEREKAVENKALPIYRAMFKKSKPLA
jgi:tRNA (guanine-N7-)-methyltransferase